jgi:predicted ATP-dependent serine protease
VLLDEQLVVFGKVRSAVASGFFGRTKQVLIIRGGPGTVKSVLAINLLAQFLKEGRNAHYVTGSKAFTETLWQILGNRSKAVLKYTSNYGHAEFNELDVLICDESRRIREITKTRFMKRADWPTRPQVRELLDAAKVAVFFIDDLQSVRHDEIGSSAYIRDQAAAGWLEEYPPRRCGPPIPTECGAEISAMILTVAGGWETKQCRRTLW